MRTYFTISLTIIHLLFLPHLLFAAQPQVVETHPPNGALGVRPDFDRVTIKYDQPIKAWCSRNPAHRCFEISPEWALDPVPGDYLWGDRIIIPRDIVAHVPDDSDWNDILYGTIIDITINPPGASPDHCFCDMEGNLLTTHHLQFTIREHPDDQPVEPWVVSAEPPDGATGIDPTINTFSITFSEPMVETTKGYFSFGWGPADLSWSADGKTVTFTRKETDPIPAGYDIALILNYDEGDRFRDLQGNVLKEHTYTFRIAGDLQSQMEQVYDMDYVEIPADPSKGFHWPYNLGIPKGLSGLTTLLVVPNNSGRPCEDQRFHGIMAKWDLYSFSRLSSGIQVPLLVPTFPRTISAYLQNLSGIVFRSDLLSSSLERIDRQLLAMIEDALKRLKTRNINPERKVFMTGFSASGQFASCFSIVHSNRVKAAAAGGGQPTVPVSTWNDEELRYFKGIANLEELTGEIFDLDSFVDIPLFFYIGDQDTNFTGCPGCFSQAEEIYESVNASSKFEVYTNVGHWISDQGWTDLQNFFASYPPDPTGSDDNYDGGYNVSSKLWIKAVLQVPGSPVKLVWKMVGADIIPSGDQVISGYFYADPNDFAYGSVYNPELFAKMYIATNGWCNIAFNHVTIDSVSVYSAHQYYGYPTQSGTATLTNRLVEHQYNGVAIDTTLQSSGGVSGTSSDTGYTLTSDLWAKAILQPAMGPVNLIWKEVGTDTTPSGDKVVSGYFYVSPDDFAYGSVYNPEVFVKAYIAVNGWANIAFNHVTVDEVGLSSAHKYSGLADQSGTATLNGRLVEHQYDGVSLQ